MMDSKKELELPIKDALFDEEGNLTKLGLYALTTLYIELGKWFLNYYKEKENKCK